MSLLKFFWLVSGEIEVIAHAVCCGETYRNQDAFDVARAYIEERSMAPLFITGAGGQGKTVLMMELAKYFCEKNYPVFWLSIGKTVLEESAVQEFVELLDEVSAVYGRKALLMLDNPYADLDSVEKIYHRVNYESHSIQMIVTERINRLDYFFSDDKLRFTMWSEEGFFLCLGKTDEFKSFSWIQQSTVIPFHSEWRHQIAKNIFRKLHVDQKAEISIIDHIMEERQNAFDNSSISLVEMIYQLIFLYNARVEQDENIKILGKRIPLDWDEWENWLISKKIKDSTSYAYIAALCLLKISVSVKTLSRILNIPEHQLRLELENGLQKGYREPMIYDSENETVSIKHDVIADLYFKFHPKLSCQRMYEILLDLMTEKELIKFTKKLFNKKAVIRKTRTVLNVDIDYMISVYVKKQNILELLEVNGELPWFQLVRVWNKQTNPQSKDQPYSLDELAEKYKEDKKVLLETAMYYKSKGNEPEKAEKLLVTILKKDSANLHALNELARFYAGRGRDKEAEETFLHALEVDSNHIPVLNELGRFYAGRGRDKEAEETFQRALEVDSDNIPALNELGRFYAGRGRDKEAEETFLRALEVDNKDIPALNELGRFYAGRGRDKEAEETFLHALEVDSNHIPVLNELGRFYAGRGRDKEAEETFQRALEVDSDNIPALNELGRFYAGRGRDKEAEETFLRALEVDNKDIPALNELGRFYAGRGRDKEAEETFLRALEVDSNHLPALNELGRFYAGRGRDKEAEETFLHALEVDSNHLPALNELGRFYAGRGRDKEAEETFLRALEVDSNHLPALNELGRFYAGRGRDKEAEETFLRALEVDSDNIPVLNELGRFYAGRGRDKEAEETFLRALEVDSDNIPVLNELAWFYAVRGRDKEAEETFLHALELDNDNLPVLNELAQFYGSRGRDKEAEETFLRALELDNDNLPVLNELAQFYGSRGRDKEAEKTLLRGIELEANNLQILNELGRLYKKEKKNEQALEIFERIISISGDDIIALYEAARLNKQLKHVDVAIQYYNTILKKSAKDSRAIVGLFYCYYDDDRDVQKAGEILEKYRVIQDNKYYLRCCMKFCIKLNRTEDIERIKEHMKKIGLEYVN